MDDRCPDCGMVHLRKGYCPAASRVIPPVRVEGVVTSTYRYRDKEARRAYMRDYMAKRRAADG
jgi:hypothetical protein